MILILNEFLCASLLKREKMNSAELHDTKSAQKGELHLYTLSYLHLCIQSAALVHRNSQLHLYIQEQSAVFLYCQLHLYTRTVSSICTEEHSVVLLYTNSCTCVYHWLYLGTKPAAFLHTGNHLPFYTGKKEGWGQRRRTVSEGHSVSQHT